MHRPGFDQAGLFEASPNAYLVLDRQLTIAGANGSYLATVRRELPDLLGRSAREAFPTDPDTMTQVLASVDRVIATGQPDTVPLLRFDLPRAEAEGGGFEERWWSLAHTPLFDAEGEVSHVLQDARNVTAEWHALERLRASEARFRSALEIETVGAIFFNMEGRITDANDAFLQMGGYSRADLEAGRLDWRSLTPPEWLDDSERAFAQLKATGVATPYEKEYLRPDGSRWWGLFAAKLLPDGLGFEFVIDITERRRARARRETLARLSDRLRDPESEQEISFAAAEILGTALHAKHVGYAAMDDGAGMVASGDDWSAPGSPPIVTGMQFQQLGPLLDDFRRGEPVVVPDVRQDGRTAHHAAHLEARQGRSLVVFPVMERGHLVAVFFVKDNVPRPWPPEDLAMIREVAQRTRTAVERARQETARREAEAALRHANETLELRVAERTAERDRVWRLSRDLLVVVRTDGVLQAVNPAWRSILGYAPEEVVGRSFLEFVWPGDEPQALRDLETALGTSDPVQIVMRYRHRDGSLRWISWLTSVEGEHVYASGRDITEEKARQAQLEAAEAARREADELYRAYFQKSTEGLFVIGVLPDGGFSIRDVNPAYDAAVGLAAAGRLGQPLEDQFSPEIAAMVAPNYRRALETGEVQRYRETAEFDGRPLHVETVLVPVRDEQGRITRIMGSSRDMTAQVEAEEKLRQSQKLESMGQLTGGVAHDFNNLLTPIMTTLDRLQWKRLGDSIDQRLIDGALQSAERARVLVQRLLAFARRQPLQATVVDVGELVRGMADLVASTTGPQITVSVEVAPDLRPALADANQIEMAILNLSLNARDAMPEGGQLRIAASNETVGPRHASGASPGAYVRLSVSDTGTGMDEATLSRAVEPFFSTKGVGRGTGLGLSMAHGLAAQLGGALTLSSQLGVGTNVELWIPAADEVVGVKDAPLPEPVRTSAGRVLLVDDEDLVRGAAAFTLGDLGFDVTEAASAEEALGLLDQGLEPDLLVTDHLMPGMSGTDLVRVLRTRRPGLPAILVSGYADAAGVAPDLHRLQKPFRSADLARMVATVLEKDGA